MTVGPAGRELGLKKGEVFPADQARSLLNPLRRLVQSPRRTVAAAGLPAAGRVLELGCGPGFFSPDVVAAVPRGDVVLADLQQEMLVLARQRVADRPGVGFVQADAMALPLATGSLDAVMIATMLGEVPDPHGCVTEVRRLLRPGGVMAVCETRRDSDFIALGSLRTLVERHAFRYLGRRGVGLQYTARFQAV